MRVKCNYEDDLLYKQQSCRQGDGQVAFALSSFSFCKQFFVARSYSVLVDLFLKY